MARKVIALMTLVLLPALSGQAGATSLMAIWDFGPNAPNYSEVVTAENVIGVSTLVLDGGQIDINGKNGTGYTDTAGIWHEAGQAGAWEDLRVAGGKDAEWIMTINTTSWEDMMIRWDCKAWDANTRSFDLDYRIGGSGVWTEILNNEQGLVGDETYQSFSYDLSSITAIENQAIVEFRFYNLDRYGNGKFAFDNLELSGAVIPEPTSIFLLGLGGLAFLRKRRAKQF